jgi:signal transduction histidine kinase
MDFLDRLFGAPQEVLAAAGFSATDARLLHEIGWLAVALSVLFVGVRLARRDRKSATDALDGHRLALYEAEEEAHALRLRVAELEETVSLFAGAMPLVRAPRTANLSETGGAPGALDGYRDDPGEPSMTSEPQPSRARVLVVEDNRDLNRFLCRCLGQEFDVLSAKNGAEGFEIADKERPDCVLTDVMMPVMSGEQLVTKLRSTAELEGIPIVVLTARDDDQLRIKLLKEGVQDFITKPFLTDEVLARVRNLVASKRAADVLSEELATKRMELETMAREVSRNRHELQTTLQQMQMARDLAERASSVKSNFLRMMSHELRTPIAAMQLQLRLMEKHGAEKLEEKQREYLARISRSAQRLLDLVNTVLEYARIESGRFEARVRPFSLDKVLREATEEFQSHAAQKGIRLTVSLPDEGMPDLTSDAQVVRLIAVNLIGNGVKHTEEGGVEVGGAYEEGVHLLWVKDTGPGIPREHQMEVFEPFQRFEDIRQLQGAGSGLGLAIVRDMVRAVGGDISLESDVGKGALFRVTLPMLPLEEEEEQSRPPSPGSFLHH